MSVRRLITGSRDWKPEHYWMVWDACHEAESIVVGDCPTGADLWARRFCAFYQRPLELFGAHWTVHGRAAGPIRNQKMVDTKPDDARAFFAALRRNAGTWDCWRRCRAASIPIEPRGWP